MHMRGCKCDMSLRVRGSDGAFYEALLDHEVRRTALDPRNLLAYSFAPQQIHTLPSANPLFGAFLDSREVLTKVEAAA